ncbi:MAG: HDIG domain-containing protein [Firmicutes bacterium]|nr:HDIG domain-containing protein [Bacillota bacterium]
MAKDNKLQTGYEGAMQWLRDAWRKAGVRQSLLGLAIFLTLVGILVADLVPAQYDLKVGQVSPRDIEAPRTIENRYETERLRSEAVEAALNQARDNPDNYVIDGRIVEGAEEKLASLFEKAESLRIPAQPEDPELSPEPVGVPSGDLQERIQKFQTALRDEVDLEVDKQSAETLLTVSTETFVAMEQAATTLAVTTLRNNRITGENRDDIVDSMYRRVEEFQLPQRAKEAVAAIVEEVIRPNLVLDQAKLESIKQEAAQSVTPVMVLQGEIVVRKGDVVTREKLQILKDLGLQNRTVNYLRMFGMTVVVLLLVGLTGVFLWQYNREIIESEGLLALLGLIVIIVAFVIKVLSLIPWQGTGYLMPVAFGAMLITLLLDSRLAILLTAFFAVIVGLVTSGKLAYAAVALIGGITATLSLGKVTQRSDVTRVGFIVGAANFAAMVAFALIDDDMFLARNSYLGLLNGIISAILTIGFLPYLENIFGITSSIKLLELSNPNQPLLRRLLLEAPGTYHHSIIVGNLAEAAAEAVGADGLLARVGAAYHDVGKVRRPYFFVENQLGGDNPHDRISPSLSTLIITSHVKEGIELAKQYKLPAVITDFIKQHHGDDLVKFFYHKAVESDKDGSVDETDFRYPGPKPQTKETAIVMLADSVEAAVRSLSRPTPGRIEGLVRKIIKSRLNEGLLDESDLTLRDLDKVAEAFVQVLSGIYHHRIEYPDLPEDN